LAEVVALVKLGVPYDAAMEMSPARRMAFLVISGEQDGGSFDWDNLRWRDKD
jgi:hypothetical protein